MATVVGRSSVGGIKSLRVYNIDNAITRVSRKRRRAPKNDFELLFPFHSELSP